jgi:hypothetical protein
VRILCGFRATEKRFSSRSKSSSLKDGTMRLWKKQTVRWTKDGKNVPKGTTDLTKKTIESKRFYRTLKLASGKTKQIPLSEDEESSKRLLQKRQDEEDKKKIPGSRRRKRMEQKPSRLPEAVQEGLSVSRGFFLPRSPYNRLH